jgi:leucyl aminopeptidase (aminopeptidase T)
VRAGEDVLIVSSSDQNPALTDALAAACDAAGAGTVTAAVIASPADMTDYRHPAPVIAAVERADLTIVATTIRFPRAYDDLSKALYAAGKRQVLINNAPLEDFTRGAALAEPKALRALTHALAKAVSGAKQVRVTSPNGTDLTVGVCRPCLPLTGHAEDDTGFGSFPSGEAMSSPEEGTASGTFVADAFGQVVYLGGGGPQLGILEDPIRMTFEAGRLTDLSGGAAARRLQAILDAADDQALSLGELGLGTNPAARDIGHVENKFRRNTTHIALGDNHLIGWRGADIYGGTIVSNRHIDLVANGITIHIDGTAWQF